MVSGKYDWETPMVIFLHHASPVVEITKPKASSSGILRNEQTDQNTSLGSRLPKQDTTSGVSQPEIVPRIWRLLTNFLGNLHGALVLVRRFRIEQFSMPFSTYRHDQWAVLTLEILGRSLLGLLETEPLKSMDSRQIIRTTGFRAKLVEA